MRVVTLLLALVCVAAACGNDRGDAAGPTTTEARPTTTTTPPPAQVEHRTLVLTDATRPTEAGAGLPGAADRRLVTQLWVPAGDGPFPLVAFSHGLAGHPRKFTHLFRAWAEAGYLVAAPAFPLSNDEVPGESTFTDLPNQPGDVSFVISEVLDQEGDLVDPDRIGVAGLSLGGATTYGLAFNDCCRDDRVTAVMVLDGARLALPGEFHLDSGLPLLIMHADEDYSLPYRDSAEAYALARPPKWFVTLHEAAHAEPYENTPDPADDLVRAVTTAFWDRYLGEDESAEQRLVDAVRPPSLASLAHQT